MLCVWNMLFCIYSMFGKLNFKGEKMDKLFLVNDAENKTNYAYYGERGIISAYMQKLFVDEKERKDFLLVIQDKHGEPVFKDLVNCISTMTVFSEFCLGNIGFGNPDGAIYFECGNRKFFIFVEAKMESYEDSCKKASKDEDGYNSTIKGQLELKWRFINAVRSNSEHKQYVEESDDVAECFKDDCYYKRNTKLNRRLHKDDNLNKFIEKYINNAEIYFLAITLETGGNPFVTRFKDFPENIKESLNVLWCDMLMIKRKIESELKK